MLDLKKNPELSWIRDDRKTPGLTAIIGGTKLRPGLLVYPVRRGDLVNLVAAHADTRDQLDAIGVYDAEVLHPRVLMSTCIGGRLEYGNADGYIPRNIRRLQ
jgi:hypothetical protein